VKLKYFIMVVLIFLIISLTAISVYLYYIMNKSLPQHLGVKSVTGIESAVEINFDQMGIPQIWAQSEREACFALGWLHAQDRLFQIDLIRRVAQGRLSEMLGKRTLAFDQLQRKIGHNRMAGRDISQLDKRNKNLLQAYVDGINSGARDLKSLPFEYHLLRFEFEPWTIRDCLGILSYQTWFSDALQANDEFYLELMKKVPDGSYLDFMIPFPDWSFESVPREEAPSAGKRSKSGIFDFTDYIQESFINSIVSFSTPFTLSNSSNAWVVAPQKTKQGAAILASDPHLDISMLPEFWYAAGVHVEEDSLNVFGLTTPGLPFLAYGRNDQAAWAFTAGGVDVSDYYLEKINPQDSHQYQVAGGWKNFEVVQEIILIKGSDAADTLQVKIGRHGPVLMENDSIRQAMCLYWAGFDCSIARAVNSGFKLSRVADFDSFRSLITNFGALNANWVYADRKGNIGYQLGTPVPIRNYDQKVVQIPGWDDSFLWQGYYPLDQTPHAYNPVRGWLATCNNRPGSLAGKTMAGNFAEDRILRINELLSNAGDLTAAEMTMFQMDLKSSSLLRWKTEVIRILKAMGVGEYAQIMNNWKGQMDIDSRAAGIIETWFYNLKQLTFQDELKEITGVFNNRILFRDYIMEYLYFQGNPSWFDDKSTIDRVESRDEIASQAMQLTMDQVKDKVWGDLQQISPAHPLAEIPLVSQIFSLRRGPFTRGGSAGTLNAATPIRTRKGKFSVIGGPSARLVFDFTDRDANSIMLPAGQSGNPVSIHFFDFYEKWEKGEVWSIPLTRSRNYQNAATSLKLEPLKKD